MLSGVLSLQYCRTTSNTIDFQTKFSELFEDDNSEIKTEFEANWEIR